MIAEPKQRFDRQRMMVKDSRLHTPKLESKMSVRPHVDLTFDLSLRGRHANPQDS